MSLVVIGVVGAIMFAGGFIAFSLTQNSDEIITSENTSDSPSENLNIGAYVLVETFNSKGDLYNSWDGHNSLHKNGINSLVGCISGLDTSPNNVQNGCSGLTEQMILIQSYTSGASIGFQSTSSSTQMLGEVITTQSLIPEGCTTESDVNNCTGWKTVGSFDFIDLTEPTEWTHAYTRSSDKNFNVYWAGNDDSTINPGDRVIVTMTFNVVQ